MEVLLGALLLLQILDYWTTKKILERGGQEYNPIIEWLMTTIGITPALIVKGLIVMAIGLRLSMEPLWGLGLLVTGYIGVIMFNLKSLKKENKDGN